MPLFVARTNILCVASCATAGVISFDTRINAKIKGLSKGPRIIDAICKDHLVAN